MKNTPELTRSIILYKESNEQTENSSKNVDKLLNSEIPSNFENIIDYLIQLDESINNLSEITDEKLKKLDGVVDLLLHNINLNEKIITLKSKDLYEKLKSEIINLKQIIGNKGLFDMKIYAELKKELPELVIDNTINSINETLGKNPHSILIGVKKYSQTKIYDVPGAINDSNAVKDKLTQKYKVDEQKMLSLKDESATKKNILDAIKNSPNDKPLFIYFAGHGIDGYIIPYLNKNEFYPDDGTSQEEVDKLIKNVSISPQELFEAIGNRKTILIVDKCYAGKLAKDSPKNITVITSSNEKMPASDFNFVTHRSAILKKGREETNIPKGFGNSNSNTTELRGIFTAGLTSGNEGFNLRHGIQLANNLYREQKPNISNNGVKIETKK